MGAESHRIKQSKTGERAVTGFYFMVTNIAVILMKF